MSTTEDLYGLELSGSREAVDRYNGGVSALLRIQQGGLAGIAASVDHDPSFALGHAALALLGHEFEAPVDVPGHLAEAERLSTMTTERERSHVHAVAAHVAGDSGPLVRHLVDYPLDALLLSVAVPTIAFAGVTTVPEESWAIVERAEPAYGGDWWYSGLLAFIRQEQHRWDDAMALSCRSLEEEPTAGHSVHARAHVHYETGEHQAGRDWLDGWIKGPGQSADSLSHYSWHAALHELSMGDFAAVRARYEQQLAPPMVVGCRAMVDSCSLLWRWSITPGAKNLPRPEDVVEGLDPDLLDCPPSPFMAMHAAITLCAVNDTERLDRLDRWAAAQADPTFAEVVAPLADALHLLTAGDAGGCADRLAELLCSVWRLGGSEAQREVIEDTMIAALLAAGRFDEARPVIDKRLDRRQCKRDREFLARTEPTGSR